MQTEEFWVASKEILDKTGISRATLNNYIKSGILPRPQIRNPGGVGYGPRQMGYFPSAVIARILSVQEMKRSGWTMEAITRQIALDSLKNEAEIAVASAETPTPASDNAERRHLAAPSRPATTTELPRGDGLCLTVDEIPHPAYMLNYRFEIIWLNEAARHQLLGKLSQLPAQIEERNVFRYLLADDSTGPLRHYQPLIDFHVGLAKGRVAEDGLAMLTQTLEPKQFRVVNESYQNTPAINARPIAECPLPSFNPATPEQGVMAYATQYREGILFVYVPTDHPHDNLLHLLARRDEVIRSLLRRRLPVLTHLVALVADLQNSVRICAELPPEEYFELINQIWATLDPVFRRYYGAYGKHTGDGLVYYFFQQPDSNYMLNALRCAVEIRAAMRRISKEWQIRKGWFNDLFMNIGLNEGQEWLGTFQTSTSVELTVLGDTINQSARLSDLARFGEIWTTKGLLAKLSADEREGIHYGVKRKSPDGREQFVLASYTTVGAMIDLDGGRHEKLRDIAHLSIAEIIELR